MLTLTRWATPLTATYGTLEAEDFRCLVLELPYKDNTPTVSCVPPGQYNLEEHESSRYEHAWALVGGTVAHYPGGKKSRSACLFHAANWPRQLQGCLAPGAAITHLQGRLGVSRSLETLKRLDVILRRLEPAERRLSIVYAGSGAVPGG